MCLLLATTTDKPAQCWRGVHTPERGGRQSSRELVSFGALFSQFMPAFPSRSGGVVLHLGGRVWNPAKPRGRAHWRRHRHQEDGPLARHDRSSPSHVPRLSSLRGKGAVLWWRPLDPVSEPTDRGGRKRGRSVCGGAILLFSSNRFQEENIFVSVVSVVVVNTEMPLCTLAGRRTD